MADKGGQMFAFSIEGGVRAAGERTLIITLDRPASFFLSALYLFFPVPQSVIERHTRPARQARLHAGAGGQRP